MNRNTKMLGAAAGFSLTLGAAALGAVLAKRRDPDFDDDAPPGSRRKNTGKHALVGRTVTIRKPRGELYAFWRDFGNLPQFMENLDKLEKKGGPKDRSVWTVKAPGGRKVDVETEIAEEIEDQLIAWRSVEGSDIETEGRVTFEDAPGERGTRVSLVIAYDPPAGELGRVAAKAFLREPEVQSRHDLKRFKMLMETGEIATSVRRSEDRRAAEQQENA